MHVTDIFIRRPVLATVVSLLILLVGVGGYFGLSVRQYPQMKNTVISIDTVFHGADAATIKSFISEPIQQAIATVDGIDTISSQSRQGLSTVVAQMKLNADANAALTEITGKVSSVRHRLPSGSEVPSITKRTGQTFPELIMAFVSEQMNSEQVTAYIQKVVRPKLSNVTGVAKVVVWGGDTYAMRLWLDPKRMASQSVSPTDVVMALEQNNVQAQAGDLESAMRVMPIEGGTSLSSVDDFEQLVVKKQGDHLIRMNDIATVELAHRSQGHQVVFNGKRAHFAAITLMPEANPLTVIRKIMKRLPDIRATLPKGMSVQTTYDSSEYIASALHEVVETLAVATVIVMVVIFFCLGSWRAVMIPLVAIPLSLIGVCFLMRLMGFSLNLLTFLAMVLAIGLVVDDAIVVVENIDRHLATGKSALEAALLGAREIAGPVVVMTLTLAAVFAPLGFVSGVTGALFREFAFTLAAAVVISGVVALTLSPMLCCRCLSVRALHGRFASAVTRVFALLSQAYGRSLTAVMNMRSIIVFFALVIVVNLGIFYVLTPKNLAPTEDQGFLGVIASAPASANQAYLHQYNDALARIMRSQPAIKNIFMVDGVPSDQQIFSGMIFKPWHQRKKTPDQLQPWLQKHLGDLPGIQAYVYMPPALPGSNQNLPVSVVLKTTQSFEQLAFAMDVLKTKARDSGLFTYIDSDLSFNHAHWRLHVDRDKASDFGISMRDIAMALSVMVGDQGVTRFSWHGDNFEVVPQAKRSSRLTTDQLGAMHVRAANGEMIPLSALVAYETKNAPVVLKQFQQLNASTLSAALRPGVSLGEALDFLRTCVQSDLSNDFQIDYQGASRQFMQEGHALLWVSLFSLLMICLLLAAQYESFRDPFIILLSVPMSLFGALLPLFLGLATVNIYTQIGMITLVGVISKHGILMVSRANALQREGVLLCEAIVNAATQRLRPILMTTAAMVFGVIPLLTASGAGAASRFDLGLVIASGMLVGTCFTLWVVPVFYRLLSRDRQSERRSDSAC